MKKRFTKFQVALCFLAVTALTSCEKDKEPTPGEDVSKEFKYVRLVVTDEVSTRFTYLDPATAATTPFEAKHPAGTLYPTASGRYAAIMYASQNLTEFFDTGLEYHGDHVDVKGTPKWGAISANGSSPAHFKSKGAESLIFNDGDGTLHLGNEANFHTPGAQFTAINAGIPAHHGAMAQFDNGNIAVTESRSRVRVINKSGGLVHASTVEVANIHGNASDGESAVFGAFTSPDATVGGVLVVKQNGEQRVIANPDGFGAVRLGTVLYAKEAKRFIGFGAAKGAYQIDLAANRIVPIYEGTDVVQCKLDMAGKNLLLLTLDGKLRIYNLQNNSLVKEGVVTDAIASGDTFKPVLEATSRFAYLAVPATGEVHQIKLDDFNNVVKHPVSSRPIRLALLGYESNESH